jgi:hypothetical protein
VYIEVAKDGGAVVAAEGKMEAFVGEDLVHDSPAAPQGPRAGAYTRASPNRLTTRRLPTLAGPNPALPLPSSTRNR